VATGGWFMLGGRITKPAQAAHLSIVVLPLTNLSGEGLKALHTLSAYATNARLTFAQLSFPKRPTRSPPCRICSISSPRQNS
jgi:hypothetical protein